MSLLKAPEAEPIPGYRLLEPLGKGGFGEVWKCLAPGGLLKAVKFVAAARNSYDPRHGAVEQELRSLERIKSIRHPFLLSIDRIEIVDGELVMVMELAERNLHDQLTEHRQQGRPGIPRAELLGYCREIAEVLDVLNLEHGLQHLDVKPRNLFLIGRHVKVADYGLVGSLAESAGGGPSGQGPANRLASVTPLYASPESFRGFISLSSDQYSLAITYHELLTSIPPLTGDNFRQLAMQHLQAEPNLARLSDHDRAVLARALAKDPQQRFPSCTEFVQALFAGGDYLPKLPTLRMAGPTTDTPVQPERPASDGSLSARPATDQDIEPGEMASTAVIPGGHVGGGTPPPTVNPPRGHVGGGTPPPPVNRPGSNPLTGPGSPTPPAVKVKPPDVSPPAPTRPVAVAPAIGTAAARPAEHAPSLAGSLSVVGSPAGQRREPAPASSHAGQGAAGGTSAALPGYQFLECLARSALGEVWKTQSPTGQRRLVKFLFGVGGQDPAAEKEALTRLRSLQHGILLEAEYLAVSPGRVAVLTDPGDQTLADLLRDCQRRSLPGLPREQLLEYLCELAEALDLLVQMHRLQHLALTPRQMVLTGNRLSLSDFGLVELLWLPAGQQPGMINTRYAAPELFEGQISRSADQYSLALIFQELLTGVHPFRNLNPKQMANARLRGKPDLGMLPGPDRAILSRALNANPERRFHSCAELIESLRDGASFVVAEIPPESSQRASTRATARSPQGRQTPTGTPLRRKSQSPRPDPDPQSSGDRGGWLE